MIAPVPPSGEWKEKYNEFGELELTFVRNTALICWPVEWIDNSRPVPKVEGLHVTCVYIPDLMGKTKDDIKAAIASIPNRDRLGYKVVKVNWPSAFGPDENIPVLEVDLPNWWEYRQVAAALDEHGIAYSKDFKFSPHCTVDLKTVLNPPKKVLIRPLELWFKDNEPEVI